MPNGPVLDSSDHCPPLKLKVQVNSLPPLQLKVQVNSLPPLQLKVNSISRSDSQRLWSGNDICQLNCYLLFPLSSAPRRPKVAGTFPDNLQTSRCASCCLPALLLLLLAVLKCRPPQTPLCVQPQRSAPLRPSLPFSSLLFPSVPADGSHGVWLPLLPSVSDTS